MTPLGANLRHLYQWRGMWLMYTLLTLMSLPTIIIGQATDRGMFAFPLWAAFVAGTFMSHHVLAIMASPLSFCLPGHQKVTRQFVAIVGVVISAVLALVFLAYPALPWPLRVTALVWAFSANLAIYGLGSQSTVFYPISNAAIVSLIGRSCLLALVAVYFDGHVAIVNAIIEAKPLFIGACLILAVYTLSYWGKREVARGFCGTPKLSGFDAWNTEKTRRVAQARWAAKGVMPSRVTTLIERFFLARMDSHHALSTGRAAWGGIYATLGGMGSDWKGMLLFVAFIVLFCGYRGPQGSWIAFVFWPAMLGMCLPPAYSTLSVPSGRQERFIIGIGVALMGCVLSVTIVGGAVLLAHLVAPFVPDLNLKGHVLRFQPLRPWGLWITLAVPPLFQAVRLFSPRGRLIPLILAVVFVMMVMKHYEGPLSVWALPIGIGWAVLSWSAFLAVLYRVCFRRSLVVQ